MDNNLSNKDIIGSDLSPYRVGILPLPGFALMSYACTVEPLRAANLLSNRPLYDIVHFGSAESVTSSGTASIVPTRRVGEFVDLDLLLVVAGGDPFEFTDETCFDWLRKMAQEGVRIGGISGGAVVLANAGLMSGYRMTVHWEHAPLLVERFPNVIIERRLFVVDRGRVTCGGGTSPLDLMHALIADHHGSVFAHLVSDWFLHTDIRNATAPQRSSVADRFGSHSPHVLEAVVAMESHLADPLSLQQLALIAGITPRHLNRLFINAVGQSVMQYYRQLRLTLAKRLIQNSSLDLASIAEATGYSNAGHFSNAYKSHFDVRPRAHRSMHFQSTH